MTGGAQEKDPNLSGGDIREGLTGDRLGEVAEPQFEGQTKTKLGNTEAKTFVQKVTNEYLADWSTRTRPRVRDRSRSAGRPRWRVAARKARSGTQPQGLLGGAGLPQVDRLLEQ